jgi:GMP synthase (glutamine-hydrolysing)
MKQLYVVKAGTTFPKTMKQFGDFDKWTEEAFGPMDIEISVIDAEHGEALPPADQCAGIVITGSHSMVTDNLDWSLKLEEWIRSLLEANTPIFGICYGHQLLARSTGGLVDFHPQGKEIGSVKVNLTSDSASDPLFKSLPPSFFVHATHAQSVLELPQGAVRLAANPFESNHAFRLGECAWGVQFHPEYSPEIMRSYIEEQAEGLKSSGRDVAKLLSAVTETPIATEIYRNFGRLVVERLKNRS